MRLKCFVAHVPGDMLTSYGSTYRNLTAALTFLERIAPNIYQADLRDLDRPLSRGLLACATKGKVISTLPN